MRISDWSSDVCSSDLCAPCSRRRFASRRNTRLYGEPVGRRARADGARRRGATGEAAMAGGWLVPWRGAAVCRADARDAEGREQERSEEHTSELQSLMRISYAVFCLKKKNKKTKQ